MASAIDYKITPTPPTIKSNPFVIVRLPQMVHQDEVFIPGGWWEGIPQCWELVNIKLSVVADANAANRNLRIMLLDEILNQNSLSYITSPNITASQTKTFSLMEYNYFYASMVPGSTYAVAAAYPIQFAGDEVLRIYLGTAQVGDTVDGYVRLKYINRQLRIPTPYKD